MMAGHVMELDSISVEVVQDSNTELVPLPVVWLWAAGSSCRGPGNIVIRPSRGPANVSTSPEVFLAITGNKTEKLPLLGRTIHTDWSHTVCTTERRSFTMSKRGTSYPPAQ